MDKIKRSERVAAITRMLTREPGRLFTLREFVDIFGCAKSTLSEDITTVRNVLGQYGMGVVESVNGAAGGVRFYPFNDMAADLKFIGGICEQLSAPERILEGDFLYTLDLFTNPRILTRMGEIFAKQFLADAPDVVLTVESMGVPIALMVANALGKPLVTARRDSRIWHGSVVALDYMSATNRHAQRMCLPRRALQGAKRVLLIDDFMKGGGTMRAMCSMMEEFGVHVCGIGAIISCHEPLHKSITEYTALIELGDVKKETGAIDIKPAAWLQA
ncbi:pur operon repressor [Christensenellaceae bacterium OttesenSCG-928-M15]|nr:pur operon repressor [Christensenellaceae bacterium OttesenSCG-928-M15]